MTCALSGVRWEIKLSTAFLAYTTLMTCVVLCMQDMNPEPCLKRRRSVGRGWVDVVR